MSETIQYNPEKNEIETERALLYEVYGGNGNKLYDNNIVMNSELSPLAAQNWLLDKLAEAKLSDKLTGLVAGAFDVPQENHDWYLRHARMLLAKRYLDKNNIEINSSSIREVIESDLIYLVVSIDSDISLDNRKSNDSSKGGVRRPIYGWSTRANRIASHNFLCTDNKNRHAVADLVIAEGIDYEGTILQQAKILANTLHAEPYCLIDEYVVFDEHSHDIENAKLAGFEPLVVPMDLIYSYDPISGEPYKSSSIIKRIRSQ